MKKIVSYIVGFLFFASAGVAMGAPVLEYRRTILPETTNTYDLGSSLKQWLTGYFGTICLSGDCKSAWPTGGGGSGGGAWATNTAQTLTYLTSQWTALINGTATTSTSSLEVQGNKGITSYGVINAPYFTATSTTVNSVLPLLSVTNSTTTNATSTSFFSALLRSTTGYFTSLFLPSLATPSGSFLAVDDNGQITSTTSPTGTPSGADTQVQFNDGGTFAGEVGFEYLKSPISQLFAPEIRSSVYADPTGVSSINPTASSLNFTANNGLYNFAQNGGGGNAIFDISSLTVGRNILVPDKDGTLAMLSDITNASSTLLGDSNTFTGSNTIQFLTSIRSTSTNATTTSFAITSIISKLLKTGADGSVQGATAGTDYENPLTFSNGVSRSLNAISCVTATGSVFGCLTGADWTTFNNKISSTSLSATAPIAYNSSTGIFSWFGLATTSQPASSNILVSNGGAGVYGVATTSVSCSGSTSCTSFTAIGGAPITISSTAGGASSTLLVDSNTFTGASNTIVFFNSARSTTTNATSTSFFASVLQATSALFANLFVTGSSTLQDVTMRNATSTGATTTYLGITGITSSILKTTATGGVVPAISSTDYAPATSGSSLQLANGSGGFSSYAGVTCTNQFLRALSGTGASTCASVANTDLANSSITINGASVSLGGSITVASTTLLANNNTWTGGNIFGNSTTTNATTTSLGIASIFSSILKTTATGGVVPATNGTDFSLITAQTCGAGNHFSQVTAGGIFTCTADTGGGSASTTLLADNNTFSGTNIFGAITVSSCTGCGSGGASTTLLSDSNTFSGANIFANITRSTSTQATSTNFFASILNATTALFTSFTGTNATITNATTTNLFVGTSGGTGDALTIFGATSNEWSIGYKSSNKSFSISSSTALGTNEILTILKNGFLGLFNSSPLHQLDVKGRISGQPSFDCMTLFMSQSNVTADQLGSATVGSFACEGNMFIDVNTANAGILALTTANSEGMASGTPALQIMDASIATPAANNLVFLKTQVVGSATSSLGDGIAIEATIMTPKVSNATTSVAYVPLGFSDVAITSITTTASYTLPTNGCLLTASSTPNWKLVCRKAGVTTMADTGFATSTTAFKALLVLNKTGANVYINNSLTSSATIASANLPVVWLRATVGVGLSNGTAVAQGRMAVGNLAVWAQDKY